MFGWLSACGRGNWPRLDGDFGQDSDKGRVPSKPCCGRRRKRPGGRGARPRRQRAPCECSIRNSLVYRTRYVTRFRGQPSRGVRSKSGLSS